MTDRRRGPRRRPANAAVETPASFTSRGIPLGTTGLTHPALGLGLFAMGRWKRDDEAKTRRTIVRALELGLRWFDTAEVYGAGRSERLLGDVLSRSGAISPPSFVVTKVWDEHARAEQVRGAVLGSLQRLGLPRVDLLLLHGPNRHVPIAETLEAMRNLHQEGKIGSVGVSNFSVEELDAAVRASGDVPIVVNQVRYSMLAPGEGESVLDYCRQNRILIEAYSPLAQGMLAGRYLDGGKIPAEVRSMDPGVYQRGRVPRLVERARRFRALAQDSHVHLPSIALHWLAVRGVAPVFGATSPEQVEEVLRAWSTPPSDDVLERADAIAGGERA